MLRNENFLDRVPTNKPAKLSEKNKMPMMIVTELVPPLQLLMKSLNINPNEDKLPKPQA